MEKTILLSDKVAEPFGIFSQGVKMGNMVFVSGQVSKNPKGEVVGKGDIRVQTRQCLENLKHVLEAGGATLDNVVKVTVYEVASPILMVSELSVTARSILHPITTTLTISLLLEPSSSVTVKVTK